MLLLVGLNKNITFPIGQSHSRWFSEDLHKRTTQEQERSAEVKDVKSRWCHWCVGSKKTLYAMKRADVSEVWWWAVTIHMWSTMFISVPWPQEHPVKVLQKLEEERQNNGCIAAVIKTIAISKKSDVFYAKLKLCWCKCGESIHTHIL